MAVYRFAYAEDNVYGSAVRLVLKSSNPGLHVDIGCGFGAVAEPLAQRGYTYLGFDIDTESVADLKSRGFEAEQFDLSSPDAFARTLESAIAGRKVASFTMLDVIEHLIDGLSVLRVVHRIAQRDNASLVISVPNVTHRDLGIKLLTNRWQYTETGLLDQTHIKFFTEHDLERYLQRSGWVQCAAEDRIDDRSDQCFPFDSVVLSDRTPIGTFLANVRNRAGYGANVNQFVRAYTPTAPRELELLYDRADSRKYPMSVVLVASGQHLHTLRDLLATISAQTKRDFELVVVAVEADRREKEAIDAAVDELDDELKARTRVRDAATADRAAALNETIPTLLGEYVCVLDEYSAVFAHWAETFCGLMTRPGGRLLSARAAKQAVEFTPLSGGYIREPTAMPQTDGAVGFDVFAQIATAVTALSSVAFPWRFFTELGGRFSASDDGQRLAAAAIILEAALLCGVEQSAEITSIAHADSDRTSEFSLEALDSAPSLLPPGSLQRIRQLVQVATASAGGPRGLAAVEESGQLRQRIDQLERENAVLRSTAESMATSTSWRVTRPLRTLAEFRRARKSS